MKNAKMLFNEGHGGTSRRLKKSVAIMLTALLCILSVLPPVTVQAATAVSLSSLPAGGTVNFAGYKWIILDPATGYMVTKDCVEHGPIQRGYYSGNYNCVNGNDYWPLFDPNHPGSIGAWLNNDFYNSLSSVDKDMIQSSFWIDGPETYEYLASDYCKVGLLSTQDIKVKAYQDAFVTGNGEAFWIADGGCWWLLNPPSGYFTKDMNALNCWCRAGGGLVSMDSNYGIRPAIYINPNVQVTSGTVNRAPLLHLPNVVPGAPGCTTTVNAVPNTSGNTLKYLVSTSPITPAESGWSAPAGAVDNGTDLPMRPGNWVGVYELNASNQVVAFISLVINASQVSQPIKPTVTASAASRITSTTCTLSGSITSNGGADLTYYAFCYGTDPATLGTSGTRVKMGTSNYIGNITTDLSGLTPGCTYYFVTCATNSAGTAYSTPVQSFTTASANSVITSADNTGFNLGVYGSFNITATGSPVPSLSETGDLPSGVTFKDNGNGTATLSGIPATGTDGSYPITITAANGATPDAVQSFTLTVALPATAYFEGRGTETDPYLIQSAADLARMRDLVNSQTGPWANQGVYYKLTADIDLSAYASDIIKNVYDPGVSESPAPGTGWTPIGHGASFKGVFDGNGKTISGLYIYYPTGGGILQGLFGSTDSNAMIKNLGVVKCDITGELETGGLVGFCRGTVENCFVTGKVSGGGGLVGVFHNQDNNYNIAHSYIKNCYTVCFLPDGGGGIADTARLGSITNCYSAGVIKGQGSGIVKFIVDNTVQNCVALQINIDPNVDSYGRRNSSRIWFEDRSGYPTDENKSGNYAWSGMAGLSAYIPASTTDKDKDGANLDTAADCVSAIRNIGFTSFTEADLPKYITGRYFTGGGTESDPYRISTADDLENLSFDINNGVNLDGKFFKLMNDIDLKGSYVNWMPIGSDFKKYNANDTYSFNGTFDGNGKVISHLNYTPSGYRFPWYYMGLFGYIGSGGAVKNLSLTDVSIAGHNYLVGGIAGKSEGPIDNCRVSGSIQSTGYTVYAQIPYPDGGGFWEKVYDPDGRVGGIVGRGAGPGFGISNCHVTGQLGNAGAATDLYVGGVAGEIYPDPDDADPHQSGQGGQVSDSSFNGDIRCDFGSAGGLIGINHGTVRNCHTEGTITEGNAAGLIYENYNGPLIQNCYSTMTIISSGNGSVSGFVGSNNTGLIQNCYSTGTVTSVYGHAAGFMGGNGYYRYLDENNILHYICGTIKNCYSTGQVSGGSEASGFIINNSGTVQYCYSTGDVTAAGQIAGFVAENAHLTGNDGFIANCYCTGAVSGQGSNYCGGFVARNHSLTPIQNCIALNQSISGSYRYMGRFVGSDDVPGQLSNNYAWSGMTVSGSAITGGTPTDTNGGDLADWTAVRSALVAIGFKNVPRPSYIGLGASTAPAVTSADNATFTAGSPGTFTVTTTGTPAASLFLTGTTPVGVTFTDNNDGTATISGTPGVGTVGSYPITITATNGVGADATQSFTLTVNPNANAVKLDTPSGLAWDNATPGKATWDAVSNASSYTVQLIKDTATCVDEVTTGVAATYCDFTSEIAYEGAGSYTFSVTAAGDGIDYINSDTQTVGTPYNYTGQAKTIIVGIQNGIITAGAGGSATFAAITANIADGTAVTAGWYDAGGNPATTPVGLSYSASNIASNASTITVTADATAIAGTYYFKAVSNGAASGMVTVVINAAGDTRSSAKAITAFSIGGVAGTINETNHTIAVTLPYGTDVASLTPTITVSDKANVLPASGTVQNFTSPVAYTVTAENGTSQSYIVTVTVAAAPITDKTLISVTTPPAITGVINGTDKTAAALGLPATVTLVTDGGNVQANVIWDVDGSSYDATSKAARTFTVSGTVELPSGVLNSNNVLLTINISVTVNAAAPIAPSITTTSLPGGTVGTAYSQALAATGDTPITWSIVSGNGNLPGGLSLSGNTISGTPTASGTFSFTVKAANSAGNVTKALSITVAAAPAPPAGEYTPPPAPPKQEKPKVETTTSGDTVTATTATTATTDSSGKATAAVTQAQVSEAVGKAVSEAAKQGNDAAVIVEIKVTASDNTKAVETSIPKAAVSEIAHNDKVSLKVSTPVADITFGKDALDTISGQAGGDVRISAAKADAAVFPAEIRQVVGDRPVYHFSVVSGDRTISQFNGNVTVAVPYTPEPGEDTSAIIIYYINAEGKPETVSNCHYDPATGCVSFTTTHFSTYAVGYNKVDYKDVPADAWYGKAVGFIAARGITTGTGSGKFSPAAKLTRGEFLVMMMRAYGIAPDENPVDNYADAGSAYYTGYLAAAKRLGISGGVGNNMFAPGREITRQEMFTLQYNALKTVGQLPQGNSGKRLTDFTDAGQVASWAKDAMTLFVRSGIIGGSGERLNPTGIATRAEMAQVLYNLLSK